MVKSNYIFILILILFQFSHLIEEEIIDLTPYYKDLIEEKEGISTLAILFTTDIHGYFFPRIINNSFIGNNILETGGMEYLSSYLNILKKEWKDKFIWLDGGDLYQGGYESRISDGKIMSQYMNFENLTASTIGNHEWDFGQDFLKARIKESKFPFIVANLYDDRTNSNRVFENQITYKIYSIRNIKLGVIGVTTTRTYNTTKGDLSHMLIKDFKNIVIAYSKKLRNEFKVNAVILLSHAGLICKMTKKTSDIMKLKIWNKENALNLCQGQEELAYFLQDFPQDTVDLILSGHTHTPNHYYFNDTPVVNSLNNGKYISMVYLHFDKNTFKLHKDKIEMESPIPICSKIFDIERRCDLKTFDKNTTKKYGYLRNFKFHGKIIYKNKTVEKKFKQFHDILRKYEKEIVIKVPETMYCYKNRETLLGNYIADFMRETANSDVAIVNAGICRSIWNKGNISAKDVHDMFPFTDNLVTVQMTGEEIIRTLQVIQVGNTQFFPISNLIEEMRVEKNYKKITKVSFADGSNLIKDRIYTVATTYFLLPTYGDEMNNIRSFYPHVKGFKIVGDFTNLLISYLKKQKKIVPSKHFNPKNNRTKIYSKHLRPEKVHF
jgi:5'-nucleotidase